MPWKVVKQGKMWCVKKKTGETVKCHGTEKMAKDHMKALYANAEDAG